MLVVIESPYAGDIPANLAYLKRCMLDSIERGECPFASHALYTQFLDDSDPVQRSLGMSAGFEWAKKANLAAVYVDRGISKGMVQGIARHIEAGVPIEIRGLDVDVSALNVLHELRITGSFLEKSR